MDIGSLTGTIAIEDQVSSALNMIANRVQKFAEGFDGAMGAAAISVGVVVTAVTAVTAAITALGNRGSDVNDVAATLDQFAGSAERASSIMAKMQEGTLGTVSNFDLMKKSSQLLAAGVKLTADDFGTLSKSAFVLQNQGLGPTKEMLDLVSRALLTGRTRALEMAIGKVDLSKAEDNYAKTINKTKADLTELEKTEAKRMGMLDALRKKVQEAGEQQRDFGEQLDFVSTQIKNWFDKLSGAVAASPALARAVDAIGKALEDVFGGTSDAAIKAIVRGIEMFADGVAKAVPYIAEFFKGVREVFTFLSNHREIIEVVAVAVGTYFAGSLVAVTGAAVGALLPLRMLASQIQIHGIWTGITTTAVWLYEKSLIAIGVASKALTVGPLAALTLAVTAIFAAWKLGQTEAVSDWFMNLSLRLQGYSAEERAAMIATDKATTALITQQKAQEDLAASTAALTPEIAKVAEVVQTQAEKYADLRREGEQLISGFTPLNAEQKKLVDLLERGGMGLETIAKKLEVAGAAVRQYKSDMAAMAANAEIDLKRAADAWKLWASTVDEAGVRAMQATAKNFQDIRALQQELDDLVNQSTMSRRELAINAIIQEGELRKQALKDASDYTKEKYDLIDQIVQANLAKFRRDEEGMSQFSRKLAEDTARDAQTKLEEVATTSEGTSAEMITHFQSVADAAQKAADDFAGGFKTALVETEALAEKTTSSIIQKTLSFSQAMDAARRGEGTMTATMQAGGPFTASRAETLKAWADGRYYGPVDSMGMPDFRKIGPLRGDPQESRDMGGNVSAGRSYKIGSGVEEIFTPGQSGTVVPGGGGGTTVVLNAPNGFWGADRNQVARALEDVLSARQGVTQQYTRR